MLKAGFARLDVTPPLGVPLAGYYEKRIADGVLDPIQVNAVAVANGERTLVIITADVIMISAVECDRLKQMIHERTDIGTENVMIAALHPHTSVRIGGLPRVALQDREYVDLFPARSRTWHSLPLQTSRRQGSVWRSAIWSAPCPLCAVTGWRTDAACAPIRVTRPPRS
jgi:hypothetical protein